MKNKKSTKKDLLKTLTRTTLGILCTGFNFTSIAQEYLSETITHAGSLRTYELYVPAGYDGNKSVPLLFNFHGGDGTSQGQISTGDFSTLADTANFLAVYPQAFGDPNDGGSANWIHKTPSSFEDVTFIDALIDSISNKYSIDSNRIYACGYSLGGEFTFELACRLNHRIAAIGVVARTMQADPYENCSPYHPTGVITVLGTADQISTYQGVSWQGVQYYTSAEQTHLFWANHNNCDSNASLSNISNTSTTDGSTVERRTWSNSSGCSYVEELKVIGGGHDWPGSYGNMDINATEEIWQFVSRYDLNGVRTCKSTSAEKVINQASTAAYPNPVHHHLTIKTNLQKPSSFHLYSSLGNQILQGYLTGPSTSIDLSSLPAQCYVLKVGKDQFKIIKMD